MLIAGKAMYVWRQGMAILFSAQFYCEPKTALQNKIFLLIPYTDCQLPYFYL